MNLTPYTPLMKSLWEPTRQTEEYWRGVLREESLNWELSYAHLLPPVLGGSGLKFTGTQTFTVPGGEGEWLTSSHSDESMKLPESVVWDSNRLEAAPQFDHDAGEAAIASEDHWVEQRVKEGHRREELRSCPGKWVFKDAYLRDRAQLWEWRKGNVRSDLKRWWDHFDFTATWWHPFETMPKPFPLELMRPEYAFFSTHTGAIPKFNPFPKWHAPTPKPAGWRPFIPVRQIPKHRVLPPGTDRYATFGEKQRHEPLVPGQAEPVPMPWRNPDPKKVAEWAAQTDGDHPNALGNPDFLSSYLKRLLFMNDYSPMDPFHSKPLFFYADSDENTRRVQLKASCGVRYAKSWECYDHRVIHVQAMTEAHAWERGDVGRGLRCNIESLDEDFQGGVKLRLKVELRWEIRRRDRHFWTVEEKVPGYKLHDTAAAVMAYLGCSRATAFRKIKAGFRIPKADNFGQVSRDMVGLEANAELKRTEGNPAVG
jgi:hypothetical protein